MNKEFEEWWDVNYLRLMKSISKKEICKEAFEKSQPKWQLIEDAPKDGSFILCIDKFVNLPIAVRWKEDCFYNVYGNKVYFDKWQKLLKE